MSEDKNRLPTERALGRSRRLSGEAEAGAGGAYRAAGAGG